jgi:16S rRNA (guanine1207-N2)-methyltransferase
LVGAVNAAAGAFLPTQLLQRNLDRVRAGRVLVVGGPHDAAIPSLFDGQCGVLHSFDYGAHLVHERVCAARGSGLQPRFGAVFDRLEPRPDVIVVYLQKGREANDVILAMAQAAVSPGGTVVLVGENSGGIRSVAAVLEDRVGPISFSDAARHCVLYEARARDTGPAVALESWEKSFSVATSRGSLDVRSLPGVFSHGRLDDGTAFLLNHMPTGVHGDVLDFGCGSGVIGAAVKTAHPECQVSLVDSNAFALSAAQRTFDANGLAAAFIRPSNGFVGVDECFDVIVSNPPFHQGIATNFDVVTGFLGACAKHLRPGGFSLVVANHFLPYERLMAQSMDVSLVAQDTKYKLLKGKRRK